MVSFVDGKHDFYMKRTEKKRVTNHSIKIDFRREDPEVRYINTKLSVLFFIKDL